MCLQMKETAKAKVKEKYQAYVTKHTTSLSIVIGVYVLGIFSLFSFVMMIIMQMQYARAIFKHIKLFYVAKCTLCAHKHKHRDQLSTGWQVERYCCCIFSRREKQIVIEMILVIFEWKTICKKSIVCNFYCYCWLLAVAFLTQLLRFNNVVRKAYKRSQIFKYIYLFFTFYVNNVKCTRNDIAENFSIRLNCIRSSNALKHFYN